MTELGSGVCVITGAASGIGRALADAFDASAEDWDWVLGVCLGGVVNGVRSFVPRMLAGGGPGHVVNTASMGGLLDELLAGVR